MWWTFAAAVAASATALFIAVFIYPWQKELDRKNAIHHEMRDAFRRFISITSEIDTATHKHPEAHLLKDEHIRSMYNNYKSILYEFLLIAPADLMDLLQEHHSALLESGCHLGERRKAGKDREITAFSNAVSKMRELGFYDAPVSVRSIMNMRASTKFSG